LARLSSTSKGRFLFPSSGIDSANFDEYYDPLLKPRASVVKSYRHYHGSGRDDSCPSGDHPGVNHLRAPPPFVLIILGENEPVWFDGQDSHDSIPRGLSRAADDERVLASKLPLAKDLTWNISRPDCGLDEHPVRAQLEASASAGGRKVEGVRPKDHRGVCVFFVGVQPSAHESAPLHLGHGA
jgi:hypothetical protein